MILANLFDEMKYHQVMILSRILTMILCTGLCFGFRSHVECIYARPDATYSPMSCNTQPMREQALAIGRISTYHQVREMFAVSGLKLKIPVYAHRFLATDPVCDLVYPFYTASEGDIMQEITASNSMYNQIGLNVELVLLDIIEHRSDSAVVMNFLDCVSTGYHETYDQSFWNRYGIAGAINIFCVDSDSPSAQHANFPDGARPNMVVMKYYNNGWSTLHELGHTFTLLHTFETYYGSEAVTRDPGDPCYNAETAGDKLADTEATINLGFLDEMIVAQDDPGCDLEATCACQMHYVNAPTDDCNVPLVMNNDVWGNMMNYGSRNCSRVFTQGQVDRMWNGIMTKIELGQFNFCLLQPLDNCLPVYFSFGANITNGQYIETSSFIQVSDNINSPGQETQMRSALTLLTDGFRAVEGSEVFIRFDPCNCN